MELKLKWNRQKDGSYCCPYCQAPVPDDIPFPEHCPNCQKALVPEQPHMTEEDVRIMESKKDSIYNNIMKEIKKEQ